MALDDKKDEDVKSEEVTVETAEDAADEEAKAEADEEAKAGADEKAEAGADEKAEAKAGKQSKDKKGTKERSRKKGASAQKKPVKIGSGLSTPAWVAIAAACLVVGLLLGHFIFGAGGVLAGSVAGKTTVAEGDLDAVMGTYTYNGKTYDVTVRDAIELSSTLDQAKNDDGTYNMPAADGVLSAARNQVLLLEAKNQGLEANDDEIAAYAQEQLGSSDFDEIATQYGLDADTVKKMITDSATMDKLRKSVVTTDTGDAPIAPTEPEEGKESEPTVDYFNYIIGLAGDQWDSDNNTWADPAGSYATALANYTISPDEGATYEAAQAAYYVAYQEYSNTATAASNEWVSYYNQLFSNVTVQLSTAVSSAPTELEQ